MFKLYRKFIFLRDIKLWQQYNFNYIDSQKIYLTSSQFSKFPGLLWYFKNLYKEINSELKLIEEINGIETNLNYDNNYIGYNYVDQDDYENLKLCELGKFFDTDINDCAEATKSPVEYCEHYANKNYQCLNCKMKKYIYLYLMNMS